MEFKYNSMARHSCIGGHHRCIRVNHSLKVKLQTIDALDPVHEQIAKLAPQCPKRKSREANMMEYIRNAVIRHSLARYSCSRVATGELCYQEFYGQLKAGIQQEAEERVGCLCDQETFKEIP